MPETPPTPMRKPYFCLICRQDLPGHDAAYPHWLKHERERIAAKKRKEAVTDERRTRT